MKKLQITLRIHEFVASGLVDADWLAKREAFDFPSVPSDYLKDSSEELHQQTSKLGAVHYNDPCPEDPFRDIPY